MTKQQKRLKQIAEVGEGIELLITIRENNQGNSTVKTWSGMIAREQAALAELLRGMKPRLADSRG